MDECMNDERICVVFLSLCVCLGTCTRRVCLIILVCESEFFSVTFMSAVDYLTTRHFFFSFFKW